MVATPDALGSPGSISKRRIREGNNRFKFTSGTSSSVIVKTVVEFVIVVLSGVSEGKPPETSIIGRVVKFVATPRNGTIRPPLSAAAEEATAMYPE